MVYIHNNIGMYISILFNRLRDYRHAWRCFKFGCLPQDKCFWQGLVAVTNGLIWKLSLLILQCHWLSGHNKIEDFLSLHGPHLMK